MVGDHRRSSFPPSPSQPPVSIPKYSNRPRLSVADEVGLAMLSLSKASRSFTLYDPHNDAVKMLIGDYREKCLVLARHAPVEVDVWPFELRFQKKTIYEEEDRERSLAFRLFRDGVRKIRFEPGIGWDDLVSLLEVMSIRCNGVRQQEEDLITLLRKARFQNITIESVEGYIPDEDMPENQALAPIVDDSETADPTAEWDQPLPPPAGGSVQYVPIDLADLDALCEEESPGAVAAQAVRSVFELLQTANSLQDRELLEQLIPYVEEVQHYLVVERNLDELATLATVYRDAFGDGRSLPILGEERSFERIMRMVTEEDTDIPPALYHLIGAPTPDILSRAFDMLVFGAGGARRKALLEVLTHGARQDATVLVSRIGTSPPDLVRDLFGILGKAAPTQRIEAAFDLLSHPDPAFQLELLGIIVEAPPGLRLARGLQTLMGSPHEQVRTEAAQALGRLGGAKAVPMLAEYAKQRAAKGLSFEEAEGIGTAMALASRTESVAALLEWVNAKSGLRSILSKIRKDATDDRMLLVVAVAGLARCPGPAADQGIRAVLARAAGDFELETRCQRALDDREKLHA